MSTQYAALADGITDGGRPFSESWAAAFQALDMLMPGVRAALLTLGEREIPSEKIGEMVMRELKKIDKVAYVRFASVYRNFEDVDEFSDLVREVSRPGRGR